MVSLFPAAVSCIKQRQCIRISDRAYRSNILIYALRSTLGYFLGLKDRSREHQSHCTTFVTVLPPERLHCDPIFYALLLEGLRRRWQTAGDPRWRSRTRLRQPRSNVSTMLPPVAQSHRAVPLMAQAILSVSRVSFQGCLEISTLLLGGTSLFFCISLPLSDLSYLRRYSTTRHTLSDITSTPP